MPGGSRTAARKNEAYLDLLGAFRNPRSDDRGRLLSPLPASALDGLAGGLRHQPKAWSEQPAEFCRRGSKPMARWSRRAASANRGSTTLTKACGAIIRCCSRWPTRVRCCGSSIAAAIGPATKEHRAVQLVHRAVPGRGLQKNPASRRYRLLADRTSRSLAPARGRAIRIRTGPDGGASCGRRRPARYGLETPEKAAQTPAARPTADTPGAGPAANRRKAPVQGHPAGRRRSRPRCHIDRSPARPRIGW